MKLQKTCGMFLFCSVFFVVQASHDRIMKYQKILNDMQEFIAMLAQHVQQPLSYPQNLKRYDHAVAGTKSVSEFVCSCIAARGILQHTDKFLQTHTAFQVVAATYTMLQNFGQMFAERSQHHAKAEQMEYHNMIIEYPYLVLIEHQIKMMELLIEMSLYGSDPEKIFAHIHLPCLLLPGMYQKYSKKRARKMYKKCFNTQGCLVNLINDMQQHPYKKFAKKVCKDWRKLVIYAHRFPTDLKVQRYSMQSIKIYNDYNQKMLDMIELGMQSGQIARPETSGNMLQKLYEFYVPVK